MCVSCKKGDQPAYKSSHMRMVLISALEVRGCLVDGVDNDLPAAFGRRLTLGFAQRRVAY